MTNYSKLVDEISYLAKQAGRTPSEITLVAVSKGHPWDQAQNLYKNGCRNFGENRIQEALEKIPGAPNDIAWHMVGHLQTNKVKKAIGKFALIHSVDSLNLAQKLSTASLEAGLVTNILLEINTSQEPSKYGFQTDTCLEQFESIIQLAGIQVQGLMTMAPLVKDEATIRSCFSNLRLLRDQLTNRFELFLPHLSMGMSNDYPYAIQEGATLLRIGTALFGALSAE